MYGFQVREHGGPEVLKWVEMPDPIPGPGEVRMQVAAVGVNHLDLWVRRGVEGHSFPLPLVPGSDFVGTVDASGSGVGLVPSQQRYFVSPGTSCGKCRHCLSGEQQFCRHYGIFGETRDGGYADFVVVPQQNLLPIPDHLSFCEAATMPLTFLTAWHMLVTRARVKPGEWVLVQAAASGVSSAAIQIGKLFGARVIATASTAEKLEHATRLGAQEVINYVTEDWVSRVRTLTGKAGVETVVDHVGAATFAGSVACLRRGGSLVLCGATAGHLVELDLRPVFFKGLSILGSTMGSLGEMATVARLINQGKLQPHSYVEMSLAEAPAAHSRLETRAVLGKVVLTR